MNVEGNTDFIIYQYGIVAASHVGQSTRKCCRRFTNRKLKKLSFVKPGFMLPAH